MIRAKKALTINELMKFKVNEVKPMKRLIICSFIFCIVLGLIIVLLLSSHDLKKQNSKLKLSGISQYLNSEIYKKRGVLIGELEYYEDVEVLVKMIQVDKWERIRKKPQSGGDEIMTISLQEDYELHIYSDYVWVYDGYALIGQKKEAYYHIPEEVIESIRAYSEELQKRVSGD